MITIVDNVIILQHPCHGIEDWVQLIERSECGFPPTPLRRTGGGGRLLDPYADILMDKRAMSPLPLVHSLSSQQNLELLWPGILSLSTIDICGAGGGDNSLWWGSSVGFGMFSGVPAFCPLGAIPLPWELTTNSVSGHCQCALGWKPWSRISRSRSAVTPLGRNTVNTF